MRHVTRIDVGAHKDKVGFTLHFADEDKEHYLFAPDIAEDIVQKMLQAAKDMRYVQEALRVPGDKVGISDEVTMRLVNPEEVKSDGEEAE